VGAVRTVQTELTKEKFFKKDLHFESIDVVDLLFELESAFGKEMSMYDFNSFVVRELKNQSWDFTLAQLGEFVTRKIS
jgi:acyl carrier protein